MSTCLFPAVKMRVHVILVQLAWLLAGAIGAVAQDVVIPEGVFTVGTTTLDARGRPWAYLKLIAPDQATLKGREFAVYVKPAAADEEGQFTLQGTFQRATTAALASAYVERAIQLGGDRAEIESAFRALYRQAAHPDYLASLREPRQSGDPPWPNDPPQAGEPPVAAQIAMVMSRADTDVELAETLDLAMFSSPVFAMAMGQGWAGMLPVTPGKPVTLEVRLREGGIDTGVVGRIGLVAGEPLPLPPPGAPVQVPDSAPTGDLNIQLRWGMPEELRRYALLTSGFNLYRVAKQVADSGAVTDTDALLELVETEPNNVRRLNRGAVVPPDWFTEAEADPLTGVDRDTFFFADDNNRYERDTAGTLVGTPFPDCAEFTYYVTARDLLGRDGLLSPPGPGRVQRHMAPQVPTGLQVRPETIPNQTAEPEGYRYQVAVRWTPSAQNGTAVTRYEILRGLKGASAEAGPHFLESTKVNFGANLEKDDPIRFIPCGIVDANTDLTDDEYQWIDLAPVNAPGGPYAGQTVWYAVRAVYESECSLVYSAPGPPAFAAFRPVVGPPAPSTEVCAQGYNPPLALVTVEGDGEAFVTYPSSQNRVRVACRRADANVTHATFFFYVPINSIPTLIDRRTVYFPEPTTEDANLISADFSFNSLGTNNLGPLFPPSPTLTIYVGCIIGTNAGVTGGISLYASTFLSLPSGAADRTRCRQVTFFGGSATLGNPPPAPLREMMLLNSLTATQLIPAGGGYTLARFPTLAEGQAVFLEAQAAGGPLVNVGGALVMGGQVVVPPLNGAPAVNCRAWTLRTSVPTSAACTHVRNQLDGGSAPLRLGLCVTAGAAEYRFYRQIGEDEPSLLSEGAVPVGATHVFCEDSSLPPVSARVQYYGQFLDRFGNASPLVPLGGCPLTLLTPPPMPTLHEPRPVVQEGGVAAMSLAWFCPPPGVERFEVFLEKEGSVLQHQLLIGLPRLRLSSPTPPTPVTSGLTANTLTTGAVFMLQNPRLLRAAAPSPAQTSFYTGRVGGDLGEGPEFEVVTPVERNVTYKVWVRSVGPTGGVSAPSKAWDFTWRTPPAAPAPGTDPEVPWPARPLPEAYTGDAYTPSIAVNQQTFWNYEFYPNTQAATFIWPRVPPPQILPTDSAPVTLYQRGVRIATIEVSTTSFPHYVYPRYHNIDLWGYRDNPRKVDPSSLNTRPVVTVPPLLMNAGGLANRNDPNLYLAKKKNGEPGSILPAVLYRRQVASPEFPDVTGDVIQVSPLVRRVAVSPSGNGLLIRDPFIGVEVEGTRSVGWMKQPHPRAADNSSYYYWRWESYTSPSRLHLYLLDTQPVIVGARYEYFVVRFDENTGEIKETIHAGTTEIGSLPAPPPSIPDRPPAVEPSVVN